MIGERRELIDRRVSRLGGRRATDRPPVSVHVVEALRQQWNRHPTAPSADQLSAPSGGAASAVTDPKAPEE